MTEQRQIEIRADLARAMGWDFIQKSGEWAFPGEGEWYMPDGKFYGDEPPDPFTDASDSRALVAWLAASNKAQQFHDALYYLLLKDESSDLYAATPHKLVRVKMMASPLSVIAEAAAKAMGIIDLEALDAESGSA